MKRILPLLVAFIIVFNTVALPAYAAEKVNDELDKLAAEVMPLSSTFALTPAIVLGGAGGTAAASIVGPAVLVLAVILGAGFVVESGPALAQLVMDVWDQLSSTVRADLEAIYLSGAIMFNLTGAIYDEIKTAIESVFYTAEGEVISSVTVANPIGISDYDYGAQRVYDSTLTDYQKEFYCYPASSTPVLVKGTPYEISLVSTALGTAPSWFRSMVSTTKINWRAADHSAIAFGNTKTGNTIYLKGPSITDYPCTEYTFSPICEGVATKVTSANTYVRDSYGIWLLTTCTALASGETDVCETCGKGVSSTYISEFFDLSVEGDVLSFAFDGTNYDSVNYGSGIFTQALYTFKSWNVETNRFLYSRVNYTSTYYDLDPMTLVLGNTTYQVTTADTVVYPDRDATIYIPTAADMSDVKTLTQDKALTGGWTSEDTGTDTPELDGSILDGLGELLKTLFVPDLSEAEELVAVYSNKLGWIGDCFYFIRDFVNDVTNPDEPPVIYVDLSLAESKYDWGGKESAIDLSWYGRYKEDVDTILSGIIWVFFFWRLFKTAPDILGGAGMVESTVDKARAKNTREMMWRTKGR